MPSPPLGHPEPFGMGRGELLHLDVAGEGYDVTLDYILVVLDGHRLDCTDGWAHTPMGKNMRRYTPRRRAIDMAGIGDKIKGAATKAAKDKVSGGSKGKDNKGSKSGVDKAESAVKKHLK